MWRVTLKTLLQHRVRLLLTTLSVVLGVAFVSGTFVLTDTMRAVFDDLVHSGTEGIDVLVRGTTVEGLNAMENLDAPLPAMPASIVDDVAAVEGVASAEGGVEGYALIVRPDGEAIIPMGPPTLGAAWSSWGERGVLEGGHPPQGPDEVAIDQVTAEDNGLQVGDQVGIVFSNTPPRDFTIAGISTREGGDNLAGATYAEFDLRTAQEVLDLGGRFSTVNVWIDDGADADVVAQRLNGVLPADIEAVTAAAYADELSDEIGQALSFITTILGVFAAIALVVGAFIIANTFSITVLQRTREFALLRSLGARRGQIVGSVVAEAVVVGLLASVLGIVAGLGLAMGLYALLDAFGMDMPSGTLVLRLRTVGVALAVGLLVTIVSSLLPARRAAGIHPMAALRAVQVRAYRPSRPRVIAGGLVAVAAAVLVAVAALGQPEDDLLLLGVGAVLTLVALAALGPLLTRPILRLFGGSGAHLGAVGQLARRNSLRTPRRTWTTAAALTVGLALVSSVAVLAASMKSSVSSALEGIVRADVIVTSSAAMTGGQVPPVLAGQVTTLPEVGAVSPMRTGTGVLEGRSASVTAVDTAHWEAVAQTDFVDGSMADLAVLDSVAIDRTLAEDGGYAIGDVVEGEFPRRRDAALRIAAVFERDDLMAGWVMSTQTHARLFEQAGDAAVLIAGAAGADPADVLQAVDAMAEDYPAVTVQDQAQYREGVARQVDQILALVTALLGMALFIAVLGIMNTLALSIHERTHEIGLLRAVGMTRPQVRRMVRWEAVTVAMLGAFVGLLLGLLFGWGTTRVLADQGLTTVQLPYVQLAGAILLAAVAGVLAAVLPARRAARLDVLRAVTVE